MSVMAEWVHTEKLTENVESYLRMKSKTNLCEAFQRLINYSKQR